MPSLRSWKSLPLWIQTYLVASLASSLVIASLVTIVIHLIFPPYAHASSTFPEFISDNLLYIIGFFVSFGASVKIALWRLAKLEEIAATKSELLTADKLFTSAVKSLEKSIDEVRDELKQHREDIKRTIVEIAKLNK